MHSLGLIKAQVKEVNFLSYPIKLHGIDFRIQNNYNTHYTHLVQNQSTNNPISDNYFDNARFLDVQDPLYNFLGVSTYLVFRPFNNAQHSILRSIEVGHGLIFEYNRTQIEDTKSSILRHTYRGFKVGYSPRLSIVSPTLLNTLKLYTGVDAYFFQPFYSELETQSAGYLGVTLNERYSLPYRQRGFGYTIGARIFANCNWNAHVEYSPKYLNTIANQNKKQFFTQLIQFGARYKFGQPENSEISEIKKGVFW